jgi:hypothetical protein
MTASNTSNLGKSPARSPEELAGLVFDVPCLKCGKNVFTVPYVTNTHHVLTCSQCKTETWVLVDETGGIKYFDRDTALAKIRAVVEKAAENPRPDDHYCIYKFGDYEVNKSSIKITWNYYGYANKEQPMGQITTVIDWTTQ